MIKDADKLQDIIDNNVNFTFSSFWYKLTIIFATASNNSLCNRGGWILQVTTVNTDPSVSLNKTSATIESHLNLDITYTVTGSESTVTTVTIQIILIVQCCYYTYNF